MPFKVPLSGVGLVTYGTIDAVIEVNLFDMSIQIILPAKCLNARYGTDNVLS